MGTVILRTQQVTKNRQLLENSNTDPSLLLRMTAWRSFSAACQVSPFSAMNKQHLCNTDFFFGVYDTQNRSHPTIFHSVEWLFGSPLEITYSVSVTYKP